MNLRKSNYVFIVVMLVFVAVVYVLTVSFPAADASAGFGPAFFPRLLVTIIAVCSIILFFTTKANTPADATVDIDVSQLKRPIVLLVLMIAYAFLLKYIGFIAMNIIFLISGLKFLGTKWKWSAIVSVAVTVVLFIGFKVLLKVPVPMGTILGG